MVRPERFELPAYWLSSLAPGSYIDVPRGIGRQEHYSILHSIQ